MKDTYGVIGDPISHSLSPFIHNKWMKDFSLNADYRAFEVPADQFEERLAKIHQAGIMGMNVTLPHKIAATKVGDCSDLVKFLGAANTLSRNDKGGWLADNTDVEGFREDLTSFLGSENWRDIPVTLIGAGGSAKSVGYVLDQAGAKITLANRTIEKAEALLAGLRGENHRCMSFEEGIRSVDPHGLVINSTSIGYGDHSLDLPYSRGGNFYDLSYGNIAARTLQEAREHGWRVSDGLGMLVRQAAASFRIWFDKRPDVSLLIEQCRSELRRRA